MDAVLLAGGIPRPDEPLYHESAGCSKALINVAGKPMAQWLLDALSSSQQIVNVVIIGVDPSSGLQCDKPLTFIPDGKGLLDNVLLGLSYIRQHSPDTKHILLSSTDIPTVTHEMIDWRVEVAQAVDSDLDYAAVERSTMEARFPGCGGLWRGSQCP
jgi:molybdopterin-guanine dinucleotide biosynthesis protein A